MEGPSITPRENEARTWAMFLHLSMLLGTVSLGAGFIVPIVIWQLKKAEYPELDPHGRNAVNWMISALIYGGIAWVLSFIVIGIPLAIALALCAIAFPVIAGIKAKDGVLWKYPLSFSFV